MLLNWWFFVFLYYCSYISKSLKLENIDLNTLRCKWILKIEKNTKITAPADLWHKKWWWRFLILLGYVLNYPEFVEIFKPYFNTIFNNRIKHRFKTLSRGGYIGNNIKGRIQNCLILTKMIAIDDFSKIFVPCDDGGYFYAILAKI